ncbi:MAG: pyridoxamine 5'-phosphate oxidase family protein [Antricoccus sp.]
MSINLDRVAGFVEAQQGLAVVSVVRADGTPHSSLVNTGLVTHPVTGARVIAYVTYGPVKLRSLRERPATSILWRDGWKWIGVDGDSELIGPHDPAPTIDAEKLRILLRNIFIGAGGTHDNWDEYDQAMREQQRVGVLVTPRRVYGNH